MAAQENGEEMSNNSTLLLWMLSIAMFISTTLIGAAPLFCKFKQQNIDRMAIYGAGLMVGAALLVIVPEGVMVLIASQIKEMPVQ